ncbi:MAG: glycosyltransferase family 9 protein [Deltaproteobacteria bacterium]|jgi:heptosyltransferase-2|nr:glycosyltransferase family 9 protein [Deltaproteobacteria bacterium]
MRIAVWNTAFLGDAVLTLPLLLTLRRAYPGAELDFYVRRGFAELFAGHSAIDRVYAYDKRGGERGLRAILAYGEKLRARRYDLWISAHNSLRSAFMAGQSRAEERLGYAAPRLCRLFYTRTAARRFPELHEVDRLLQLARALGISDCAGWPELEPPPPLRARAGEFFRGHRQRPVLGLHPGSVWPTKRWPVKYFARLGLTALEKGARLALFAGPGEEATAAELLHLVRLGAARSYRVLSGAFYSGKNAPDKNRVEEADILDFSGCLALPELAAFIAELDCYLGNDSGPMHLAWAQRIPVVAVFGPTTPDLGFAPRGELSGVAEVKDLPCRPCGLHGPRLCPRKHHLCMRALRPERVWPEVERRLWKL